MVSDERIVVKNATPLNVMKAVSEEIEKANPEEKAKLQAQLLTALGISRKKR